MDFPPEPDRRSFIDRSGYRDDVLCLVEEGCARQIVLGDTHAIYGTGKTTTLASIFYDLRGRGTHRVVWLALANYSLLQTNTKLEDVRTLDALKQNLDDFKRLLIDLGNQIDAQAFDPLPIRFTEITDEQFENVFRFDINAEAGEAQVSALSRLAQSEVKGGSISIDVNVENQEKILQYVLESKRQKLSEAFLQLFKVASAGKPLVVFADDFCWIIDEAIGDWLLELLGRMDGTLTLLARTITEDTLKWNEKQLTHLVLPPFSLAEVGDYLDRRGLSVTVGQVAKVYAYSKGGHPLLVSLAGDLLGRLERRDETDLDAVLDRLLAHPRSARKSKGAPAMPSYGEPIQLADLTERIDRIIAELRNDILKYDAALLPGLDVLTVARLVDYDLLAYMFSHLLGKRSPDAADPTAEIEERSQRLANEMVNRLREYAVVQDIERQGERGDGRAYRLHFLVRDRMEVLLGKAEPPEYIEKLHRLLARYHAGKQGDSLANSSYSERFLIENAAWQAHVLDWLYHLLHLKDRAEARLQLAKLYLSAFDWWGAYMSFGFCEDLLSVYLHSQPNEESEVVNHLHAFQSAYPTGYDKRKAADCWDEVNTALQNVKSLIKLNLAPEKMTSDQRLVRGHLDRFVAEAQRFYRQPNYRQAEASYLSSLSYFETDWNRMWVISMLADCYVDWGLVLAGRGDAAGAAQRFRQGQESALKSNAMAQAETNAMERDHEVISQNYRILGDALDCQGCRPAAVRAFARAIGHAYIFHFMPDNRDEYSFSFYADTAAHVLKALSGWGAAGGVDAAAAISYLRSFWEDNLGFGYAARILTSVPVGRDLAGLLAAGDTAALAATICPALPEVGDDGPALDTGVAVSQQVVDLIDDDTAVSLPIFSASVAGCG